MLPKTRTRPRLRPPLFLCLLLCLPALLSAQSLLWTFSGSSGADFYSSPALTFDGYFIIGTSGGLPGSNTNRVICARRTAASQSIRWSTILPDWVDSSPALSPDGITAYVGCWNGHLYALNVATGAIRWSYATGGYIAASPAVAADGTIYIGSADGILYALDSTGALKWFYAVGSEMESSPALAGDGSVVVGTLDGRVVCVRADGTLKWSFEAEDVEGEDKAIRDSPAIGADGTVLIGSGNGRLYALDFTGQLLWGIATPEAVDSPPVFGPEGQIYFANRLGYLTALDAYGFELWSVLLGDIFYSSPVVDALGNIYVVAFSGANTSTLYCLSSDGATRFTVPIPAVVDSSPTILSFGMAPDTLIVGAYRPATSEVASVYGIRTLAGLADTDWPKFRRDTGQAARADGGPAPELLASPASAAVSAGQHLSLLAVANGGAPLAFQWYKDDLPLAGATDDLLRLGAASAASVGRYTCRILNPFGERITPPSWIVVTEPPVAAPGGLAWTLHVPLGAGAPTVAVESAGSLDASAWSPAPTTLLATDPAGGRETRQALLPAPTRGFLRLRLEGSDPASP